MFVCLFVRSSGSNLSSRGGNTSSFYIKGSILQSDTGEGNNFFIVKFKE